MEKSILNVLRIKYTPYDFLLAKPNYMYLPTINQRASVPNFFEFACLVGQMFAKNHFLSSPL